MEIVPGLTAALSGGAVLGAPLAHDFCVISLSDRLTPWEVIEKRLACAAMGDFCVALYNPSSKGRPDYLAKAVCILLENGKKCRYRLRHRAQHRPGGSDRPNPDPCPAERHCGGYVYHRVHRQRRHKAAGRQNGHPTGVPQMKQWFLAALPRGGCSPGSWRRWERRFWSVLPPRWVQRNRAKQTASPCTAVG